MEAAADVAMLMFVLSIKQLLSSDGGFLGIFVLQWTKSTQPISSESGALGGLLHTFWVHHNA